MLQLARRNILFRLFLTLSLTTGLMGIALAVFTYHASMQRMRKEMDDSINTILAYAVTSYSIPLWDFNISHIEQLNQSLALNKMVVAVNVRSLSYFISGVEKQNYRNRNTHSITRTEPYLGSPETNDLLSIARPIIHNNEKIGTIELIYTDYFARIDSRKQFRTILLIVIGLTFFAVATTFVILRRSIMRPIMQLSRTSARIARDHDYTLRVTKQSEDEIGVLYDGFNYMLDNINTREKELQESKDYILEIINAVADPIFVKNRNHHLIMINDALSKLLGIERENILGKTDCDILDQKEASIFWASDEKIFTTGKHDMQEEQLTDALGVIHTIVTRKSLYTNGKGEQFVVGVIRDITANKAAEAEKHVLEEQLAQTRKIESIGQLAGGIAHDFNNMLGVIIGFTDMALSGIDTEDPNFDYLQEIMRAAERSSNLTKQLLAFARKQPAAPRILNLNLTIPGILNMLERIIGEGIELIWKPDPQSWPILIDPGQLDQILTNLCINARDAITTHGNITIEIHNRVLDNYAMQQAEVASGSFVCLSVTDTGCGMDNTTLEKIFDPFFTTKGVGQGTGLGLSTVHGIVKQNNGFLETFSKPRQGTTFNLYFPRYQEPAANGKTDRGTASIIGGHETILLVEDEDSMLKMAISMLHGLGFKIIPANTPEDAIKKCKEYDGAIDLLLTDVIMPRMNGCKLAGEIVAIRPDIKILFMSAYTADTLAQQGIDTNHVQLITKPFGRHQLAKQIRQVLGKS
ncbi:MAG: ATP-binding protein [Kiritimatiellia bacterium]